jgi:hypothetical protein
MSEAMQFKVRVHFDRAARGRKGLREGEQPVPASEPGRVPRVAKLLALAHRFEGLLRDGLVRDYADLARLGHVTRARISQVMNLLQLAPDVQEAVLFLPRTGRGRDPLRLADLQPVALVPEWKKQRRLWAGLAERMRLPTPQSPG